jgi:hypothetical protein
MNFFIIIIIQVSFFFSLFNFFLMFCGFFMLFLYFFCNCFSLFKIRFSFGGCCGFFVQNSEKIYKEKKCEYTITYKNF